MKHITIILSIITLIFLFVACSSNAETSDEDVQVAQASPSPTIVPTPTNTSIPTATHTPTLEPTHTSTPTVIPSPTPLVCDNLLLREAMNSLNLLDSYRNLMEMEGIIGTSEPWTFIRMDVTATFNDGQLEAFEGLMQTQLDDSENNDFRFILVEDGAYFQESADGDWRILEGKMSNAWLERFTDSQFLKPELVDSFQDADCVVSVTELHGQMAQVYSYSGFNIENIPNIRGTTLGNLEAEIGTAFADIWLLAVDGLVIPVKFVMEFDMSVSDGVMQITLSQELSDMNSPIEIMAPENVASPTFFIDLPLPEDAEILTEGDFLLLFITSTPPDEILALYSTYLEDAGWVKTESYSAEEQGLLFEVLEFDNAEQGVAVAVAVQEGYTIVSIAGGDNSASE